MHCKFTVLLSTLLAAVVSTAALPACGPPSSGPGSNASDPTPKNAIYVGQLWKTPPNETSNGTHISLLPLVENNSTVTHVILFTLNVLPNDTTVLQNINVTSPHYDWLLPQIKTLQKRGVKVMAAIGGAGGKIFQKMETDFDFYYSRLRSAIKYLSLEGLDLDIEVPTTLNNTLRLLHALEDDFGSNFTLTAAPIQQSLLGTIDDISGNLNWTQLDAMANSSSKPHGKLIDFYNAQFYSGGTPGDGSADAQIAAYKRIVKAGWEASRVCLTLLTYDLDRVTWRPIANYKKEVAKLASSVKGFGGVTGFEYYNAGLNDNAVTQRWQWVRDIGQALSG